MINDVISTFIYDTNCIFLQYDIIKLSRRGKIKRGEADISGTEHWNFKINKKRYKVLDDKEKRPRSLPMISPLYYIKLFSDYDRILRTRPRFNNRTREKTLLVCLIHQTTGKMWTVNWMDGLCPKRIMTQRSWKCSWKCIHLSQKAIPRTICKR